MYLMVSGLFGGRLRTMRGAPVRIHKATAVSVLTIAAMGVGAGTAYGAPAPPPAGPTAIHYETSVTPSNVVQTVLDSGAFKVEAGGHAVDIVDNEGDTLARLPMAYKVADTVLPISPSVTNGGRTLLLTPGVDPVAGDINGAYQNLISQWEKGWVNGGSQEAGAGAVIGAVVGCVFFLFIGCIPGAAIGGTIGGINGTSNANPDFQPAFFNLLAQF